MTKVWFSIFLILLSLTTLFPWYSFPAAQETIDINSATLLNLEKLTGIGPKIGQRIIDARPFSSVDDLVKVKGIGEKILQKIKDQGLACVNCGESKTQKAIVVKKPQTTHTATIAKNKTLPKTDKIDNNKMVNGAAAVDLPVKKDFQLVSNPLLLFFIILITTSLAGVLLLIFKDHVRS